MPELPEVETIKKGLTKYLLGHTIVSLEVKKPKLFDGKPEDILGTKVISIRRYAKVLSVELSNGHSIVIHVKMTGQLIYRGPNLPNPPPKSEKIPALGGPYTHVIFHLDHDGFLYYNDIRQFGWIKVMKTHEVETSGFVGKLGPEPFGGLTLDLFIAILRKNKSPIKIVLMDQEKIGGVGNIYANDALWLAKIHPKRQASSFEPYESERLYQALLRVLEDGIRWGGASEQDFVTADGGEGKYQEHFLVYGQQKKQCTRCREGVIEKYFLGGRGTYICSECQQL